MKYFSNLSPDELERFALLAEECGEVIQIIGKIIRHGKYSANPLEADGRTNMELLTKEVADVLFAVSLIQDSGDLNESWVKAAMEEKRKKVFRYLHHQNGATG